MELWGGCASQLVIVCRSSQVQDTGARTEFHTLEERSFRYVALQLIRLASRGRTDVSLAQVEVEQPFMEALAPRDAIHSSLSKEDGCMSGLGSQCFAVWNRSKQSVLQEFSRIHNPRWNPRHLGHYNGGNNAP